MFNKLCIANRGEIAVRIIKTCRRLGIRTLAVYSEADRHALFVGMADEAAYLGPAEARASYLDGTKLVAVARQFGADAVHPGYGFLAENAAFAELCQNAGVVFIGPHIEAIRSMGSKIEAKRIAEHAGVATVPGYHGDKQDDATLCAAAKALGFPVLIKPSAGGGGKGMRVVRDDAGLSEALTLARREALAAFADDRLLLERYVEEPRHLEVQIAGDKHGNVIHLLERECSIQRRYQKLIEEAPADFLSETIRQELSTDALRIAGGIGYDSLGTVEFIYDHCAGRYYFLEMNTRLQVEHPVTEMITGIDLVELQIRIAAGEPLPLTQADLTCNGWAIEARVNAENPAAGFLPETGTITLYAEPATDGVRIDSGITRGSQVSPYYDSLLAKVIAHGDSRSTALQHLLTALDRYMIGGVSTNSEFLYDLLSLPAFSNAPLSTRFIDQHFPVGWTAGAHAGEMEQVAAVVVHALAHEQQGTLINQSPTDVHTSPWRRLGSWRVIEQAGFPGTTEITLSNGRAHHTLRLSGRRGRY
ncbi:MAG: acetyl-CoA carboxylase biotin carboxylase subunit, partial [Dongiaceae bacterium]